MSLDNGFIDLRLNQDGANAGNESFWPSFTDIMTVIVMIFMIAMVTLLMRNMELVQQLRNTVDAERMAAELARTTGVEKQNISMQLINTENELTDLRMQLMKMQEIRNSQVADIKDKIRQINLISSKRDGLKLENLKLKQLNSDINSKTQQLSMTNNQLTNQLSISNTELANIQRILAALQSRHTNTLNEFSDLQQAFSDKTTELEFASSQIALSDQELSELRGNFDNLKVKYDKLVRPARTPSGKHVVEVRYAKADNKYLIAVKTPGQDSFSDISKKSLEDKLAKLKSSHPNKLYIKVIFPEDSGLSYSEAWEFTSHLHKHYDYYFQNTN